MKIVNLLGGLGNQMFQYALYLSLKEKGFETKVDVTQFENYKLHNGYELEEIFSVSPEYATYNEVKELSSIRRSEVCTKILRKFFHNKKTEYLERATHIFDQNVFLTEGDTYYQGYWQNEKYFKNIRNIILTEFNFQNHLSDNNSKILSEIKSTNSVSIHVRRGDYLHDSSLNSICDVNYYTKAIKTIESKIVDPKYFIFSDDIVWCEQNFKISNCTFISWNKGNKSYVDMQLMSNCKHNIIANSSFSWWAAWLNNNENKIIITPDRWTNKNKVEDIIPKTWIKIYQ